MENLPIPSKFDQVYGSEWVQPIRKGYMMKCCDCGVVHQLEFRIRKGAIQYRSMRKSCRVPNKIVERLDKSN